MSVHYDEVMGWPSEVASTISRKLGGYTRTSAVRRFKIGFTSDPEQRFTVGYSGSFDEMIVLYRTSSIVHVKDLETDFINYNWDVTDNEIGGGGGRIGDPPYFLYVVVRYKT
ncbi:MAG: hypothetical protein ACRDGM_12825 [bacterium]